jgi:hypothetical protein
MDITLHGYGLDNSLIDAVTILRAAMGTKLSKKDKDIKIAEAIGIIDTARIMIIVSEPEEQATDVGD